MSNQAQTKLKLTSHNEASSRLSVLIISILMEIIHPTLSFQTMVLMLVIYTLQPKPCTRKENPRVTLYRPCLHSSIMMVGNSLTSPLGHYPFGATSANALAASFCCGSCMPHHQLGLWIVNLSLSWFKDTVFWQVSASITAVYDLSLPRKPLNHLFPEETHWPQSCFHSQWILFGATWSQIQILS